MRLEGVDVLLQERLLHARDEAFEGDVDTLDLYSRRLLVEQVAQLFIGELLDRLVSRDEAAAAVDPAIPTIRAVAGDLQGASANRFVESYSSVRSKSVTAPIPSQRGHIRRPRRRSVFQLSSWRRAQR